MSKPDQRFKDHFSGHARDYAVYRPSYPVALYEWLSSITPDRSLAWDCATGNGQVATSLARYFDHVVATDASAEQVKEAKANPGISYRIEPAEKSSNSDSSVDLITVGQAYHWFNHSDFLLEADRVLRPGGVIAIWTYKLAEIESDIDDIIFELYEEILGEYWPPERQFIDREYQDFNLPWEELNTPQFSMDTTWTLTALLGYLNTWSGLRRYVKDKHVNPLDMVQGRLSEVWGDPDNGKMVRWPLIVKASRKPG